MKKLCLSLGLVALSSPALADNIAKCDVAVQDILTNEETGEEMPAALTTFLPATDFMISIYDEDEGHLTEIDDKKILAVYCQRSSVIPSVRDYTILETGIPLALSQNFDSADSAIMTLYYKDGTFHADLDGPDLSDEQAEELQDRIDIFNLQAELKASKSE